MGADQDAQRRVQRLRAQSGNPATGRDLTPEELAERAHCETSLAAFVKQAWTVLEPSRTLRWAPYLDLLCAELEAFSRGETRNLMLLLPPGSMKSLLVSVMAPAWEWTREPWRRYITASYSMALSTRDARRTRELISSAWYQRYWAPVFDLSGDENRLTRYSNDRSGYRLAVSTTSSTTGERGDTLLYDDPSELEDAFYPGELERASRFFDVTLTSRGIGDDTRRLLVAQRVHPEDVPGRVLAREGDDWRVVILPMRFDPDLRVEAGAKVFGPHPEDRREPGELLNPALMSEDHVRRLEISFGNRAPGVLQQTPTERGAAIFRREWIRYYYQSDAGGRMDYLLDDPLGARMFGQGECGVFVTVDLASSLSESADYTVFAAWAVTPENDLLLLDLLWERLPGERQLPALRDFCGRWRPWKVAIESTAFQLSFVQRAASEGLPVEPLRRGPKEHKELRASSLAQLMAEGRFFVLAAREGVVPDWKEPYLNELLSFPAGRHDDVVDVSSDAARELMLGAYVVPDLGEDGPDYFGTGVAGPFGPADPSMIGFDTPFDGPIRFDDPGGF